MEINPHLKEYIIEYLLKTLDPKEVNEAEEDLERVSHLENKNCFYIYLFLLGIKTAKCFENFIKINCRCQY